MATFMNGGPTSSLVVWMSSHKDDGTAHRLQKTGKEQIFTYVKAADFLLKTRVMDSNIAKSTSKTACLKKYSFDLLYSLAMSSDIKSYALETLIQNGVPEYCLLMAGKASFRAQWGRLRTCKRCPSLGEYTVYKHSTGTDPTGAGFCDASSPEKSFSERLSYDIHSRSSAQTKVQVNEKHLLCYADTTERISFYSRKLWKQTQYLNQQESVVCVWRKTTGRRLAQILSASMS